MIVDDDILGIIDILAADENTPETEMLLSRKHYAVERLREKL
jgi:hypothetical protein